MYIDNVGQHLQRDVNFWAVSSVEMARELRKKSYRRALEMWWGMEWRSENGEEPKEMTDRQMIRAEDPQRA